MQNLNIADELGQMAEKDSRLAQDGVMKIRFQNIAKRLREYGVDFSIGVSMPFDETIELKPLVCYTWHEGSPRFGNIVLYLSPVRENVFMLSLRPDGQGERVVCRRTSLKSYSKDLKKLLKSPLPIPVDLFTWAAELAIDKHN